MGTKASAPPRMIVTMATMRMALAQFFSAAFRAQRGRIYRMKSGDREDTRFRQYNIPTVIGGYNYGIARAEARGDEPKDMTKRSRPMEPLASFDKEGKLTWNEKLVKSIEDD